MKGVLATQQRGSRLVVRLRHAAIRKEEIKNKLGSEPVLANTDVIVAVDDKCVVDEAQEKIYCS